MLCSQSTCFANVSIGTTVTLQCGGSTDVLTDFNVSFDPLLQCNTKASLPGDRMENSAANMLDLAKLCASAKTDLIGVVETCKGKSICEVDTNIASAFDSCDAGAFITAVCNKPPLILDQLTILSAMYIAFVALAMGCAFPAGDFIVVFRTKLKGVLIGFFSQFLFMPLMSYSIARALDLDENFSIGLVLAGMAPGGSTSNLFTYIVDGNVALSIVMSFLSTVCEVFMLPLLWFVYISSTFTEKQIETPVWEIIQASLMILIPVITGTVIRGVTGYKYRCGCSAKHNACICCWDPRSRINFEKTPNPKPENSDANPSEKLGIAYLETATTSKAAVEKHELGTVKLTAPQNSFPGSVVEFVAYTGTPGKATVPWGVKPGEKFIAPFFDPNDPMQKDCCFCFIWQWIARLATPIAVFSLALAVYTGIRDNPYLFQPSPEITKTHVIALFFQPVGCLFGFVLGAIFWMTERHIPACRCKCGSNTGQRLDCRDLRAISIETGVQNLALMIVAVNLVFRGCQQFQVMVFVLASSFYYIFHSAWYVLLLRFCFMDFCNKKFDKDDDDSLVTESVHYRCCASPIEIHAVAEPVDPASLSQYNRRQFKTTDGTAALPIRFSASGPASRDAITVMSLFQEILRQKKGHMPALRTEFPDPQYSGDAATDASMPVTQWRTWSFRQYYEAAKNVGRALLSLGLDRHASVNIWGFNSPQWVLAEMGTIFAGGKAAGIYSTDTAEQILYKILHSNGQVVIVQDAKKLDVLSALAAQLPNVKAIVCWAFQPSAEQKASVACEVLSWDEFMSLGQISVMKAETTTETKTQAELSSEDAGKEVVANIESALRQRMAEQRPGHCCALIYTSGTTGKPKAVMVSHDNLVFEAGLIVKKIPNCKGPGQERALSYLPLSHVSGMMLDILFPLWATARTPAHVTLHFARAYDLNKGTLVHRMRAVKPTIFLGVPRVWGKIQAKIKTMAARNKGCCSCITRGIVSWAKARGEKRARNMLIGGSGAFPFCFSIAKRLVLDKVAAQLGLSDCKLCITGAAPIGQDTLAFFGALGLNIMEVYGMSECTGLATMNTEACHMWGSCGFSPQSIEVKIFKIKEDGTRGEECPPVPSVEEAYTKEGESKYQGEICFRGRHIMMGYMANPRLGEEHMATIQGKLDSAIDDDGWLHSGDKGIVTTAGMFKVTGRYKELLISAGGENVAPVPIENAVKLAGEDVISNVMMFGDRKSYMSAMVTLKAKGATGLERGTDELDCVFPNSGVLTVSAAMNDPAAIKHVLAAIVEGNKAAPNQNSTIKKFTILPHDFSVEGGELTSTLKLKRSIALQHFAEVAGRVYSLQGREEYVPFQSKDEANEAEPTSLKTTMTEDSTSTSGSVVIPSTLP